MNVTMQDVIRFAAAESGVEFVDIGGAMYRGAGDHRSAQRGNFRIISRRFGGMHQEVHGDLPAVSAPQHCHHPAFNASLIHGSYDVQYPNGTRHEWPPAVPVPALVPARPKSR